MPLSPSATRALLERLGHFPRRALGQNFLVDGNIVRKSLELAAVTAGDAIVEIGPGLGTLSGALLAAGAELWAVERDSVLHAHLAAEPPGPPERFHLLLGDAVDHPLAGYPAPAGREFKIVANLPYAIATPWLDAVLSGPLPERMVLMLQKEAAQRYVADSGTKAFGAISIALQAAYGVERGHPVAAACFHPRPDVDSWLLPLRRLPAPRRLSPAAKTVIRSCFQQRRKQIGAILRDFPGGPVWLEQLSALGISSRSRPEDIPVASWVSAAAATSSTA
ncbi:MAG TPA: 16S rRNA (adenine(1518)-N(6)/adenine(1519)-N(6))-dimethyltransferase RsmA [Opitutaceae bacterium]|jgi:16S rRNA (adenine1518-N6/adenine1519-N6)-dimethyltransferase|nr:16S rRNA (adenine(1518)-N(6)/adenine(1519)-N(6))-dimethyltransferase RsmA [Opitutaceae bacterium]